VLYRDAVRFVRGLVQDEQLPYRWSGQAVAAALSSALARAQLVRPDIWIGQAGSLPVSVPTEAPPPDTSEIPMRDPWSSALPYLAAADLHRGDTELALPERIAELEARGMALLR